MSDTIEISKEKLQRLLDENDRLQKEVETTNKEKLMLIWAIKSFLRLLGLADDNLRPKMELFQEGKKNAHMRPVLSELATITALMSQAESKLFGKGAREKLAKRFHFLSPLRALVDKYANVDVPTEIVEEFMESSKNQEAK